jgi:aspartate aminotransferase-like enzyme
MLETVSQPLVYHRDVEFSKVFARVRLGLQKLFKTNGETFLFTSSGTGAMEAAVVNLVSPGDSVLVASSGKFGERWKELCTVFGATVTSVEIEYRKSIPPEVIEERLKANPGIKFVFTTLAETSTGALNDIKTISQIVRNHDKILVVDAIAGLGADELWMDKWDVDVVIGGSQKALGCPPGISMLAINNRAWNYVEASKSPRYYWNLLTYKKYAEKGQTPYTPAISVVCGLDLSLGKVLKEGAEKSWLRHKQAAEFLRKKLTGLGCQFFPDQPSNALTVIKMPEGVHGADLVKFAKERYQILFANGQGELKGRIVRIGHMGIVNKKDLTEAFTAFKNSFAAFSRKPNSKAM